MQLSKIIDEIDAEIARLQQARNLLAGATQATSRKALAVVKAAKSTAPKTRKTRNLTAEGRQRIAEAVKRRWERQRAAAN
jgi:hypothetical protein